MFIYRNIRRLNFVFNLRIYLVVLMSKLIKMATAHLNANNEKEQIDFRIDALLRKKGWESTCDVPGSLWLWKRTLKDGRIVLMNKNCAIHMQCWFDEYGE